MRKLVSALILLLAMLAPTAAAAPQAVDKLFAQLKAAETHEDAKPIEAQILASFQASGSPTIDLLMHRAEAAQAAGNKDVARHLLDEVTALAPRYGEGWHRRALVLAEAGDVANAMRALQQVVLVNPRQFAAMAELADMLEDIGKQPEALALYRRIQDLDPQFDGLKRHIDALSRDVEGQGI